MFTPSQAQTFPSQDLLSYYFMLFPLFISSAACNILTYLTKQFAQYQHNPQSSWKPYLQVLSQLLVDEDIYPMVS